MTDTHTHLYLPEFGEESAAAVERAIDAGVSRLIFPNVDSNTLKPMLELHRSFPQASRFGIGLHPTEVRDDYEEQWKGMQSYLDSPGCVAIGEVGIDLYWDTQYRALQKSAFSLQLREAAKRKLPVIVHCREGLDEALECIANDGGGNPAIIFHSFTGTREDVRRIRDICDAYFGVNGIVTFKNAGYLREAVKEIGVDRLLLETDSPYLAPVPKRGKRNESSYLPYICAKVADTLEMPIDDVERITDDTAASLFGYNL